LNSSWRRTGHQLLQIKFDVESKKR